MVLFQGFHTITDFLYFFSFRSESEMDEAKTVGYLVAGLWITIWVVGKILKILREFTKVSIVLVAIGVYFYFNPEMVQKYGNYALKYAEPFKERRFESLPRFYNLFVPVIVIFKRLLLSIASIVHQPYTK